MQRAPALDVHELAAQADAECGQLPQLGQREHGEVERLAFRVDKFRPGVARLAEITWWYLAEKQLPQRGVNGGEWALIIVLTLVGTLPIWSHTRHTSYCVTGGLEAILGLMIILLFSGKF